MRFQKFAVTTVTVLAASALLLAAGTWLTGSSTYDMGPGTSNGTTNSAGSTFTWDNIPYEATEDYGTYRYAETGYKIRFDGDGEAGTWTFMNGQGEILGTGNYFRVH